MIIDDLKRAVNVKPLTSGNNFWAKLQPVINTPRGILLIQYSVNAGGGVRGQRTDYFVILNASKDTGILAELASKGISVVGSTLVRTASVHESELKGILALAKKGDRKIIDLGGGLVLGQIDIIKAAFLNIFGAQDAQHTLNETTEEDSTMGANSSSITWKNLGQDISIFIGNKAINPVRLEGIPYAPSGFTLGALAINVKGTSPAAKFEIPLNNFHAQQQKIAERLSRLTSGQYIRVVFQPSQENLFIGDMSALLTLARSVAHDLPARETKDEVGAGLSPVPPPASTHPSDAPAIAEPSSPREPEVTEFRVADIQRTTGWTSFYTQYGQFLNSLESEQMPNQYGVIQYRGSQRSSEPIILGVYVSAELCNRLGISVNPEGSAAFPASEIMYKNIEAREILENSRPVAILKFRKPYTLIFPADTLPDALVQHIKQNHENQNTQEREQAKAPLARIDAADKVDVKSNGTVDMLAHLSSVNAPAFGWTEVRISSASVTDTLLNGSGYALIKMHSAVIGIAVSNKLANQSGQVGEGRVSYASTEIGKQTQIAIQNLEDGKPIAITKRDATQFTIYPVQSLPHAVASHILGITLRTNGHDNALASPSNDAVINEETAPVTEPVATNAEASPTQQPQTSAVDFAVASRAPLSVPENLGERITQRKGEEKILSRIEEVRTILGDPNTVAEIRWNGVTLRLTANPTLIANTPALAEHFKLKTQDLRPDNEAGHENISWVHAFEKAVSLDGLTIFRPTNEQPPVLMTKEPDFFARFEREFS